MRTLYIVLDNNNILRNDDTHINKNVMINWQFYWFIGN